MTKEEKQLIFELCNKWVSMGLPITPAIQEAFFNSTGDLSKYPSPLDELAKIALVE